MRNRKTLVILSPAFPENEKATYWVPSQQLMVKALKKNFPELHIVVLAVLYPYTESTYYWHGVEVTSFDGNHKRKFRKLVLWRRLWNTLKHLHDENEIIGVVSFWCNECAFIGKHFAKKFRLPHYIWVCGQDARKLNKWVRFIRPKEQELLAMSDFLAKEFYKNHGIRPQLVIPNAVDPELFSSTPAKRDIDILGVGSFEPLKQYDMFVNVIQALTNSLPGIRAFHCGIGREKKKTESLIKKFGLENNVSLLGGKTHEEVLQLMQHTRVFLHPSRYEGCSTVCLEALYAGAHVISFCFPFDQPVAHWHVVQTENEMAEKALEILTAPCLNHSPVLINTMDDSARAIMNLFEKETIAEGRTFFTNSSYSHGLN